MLIPTGILINSASIILGGILGALAGKKLSATFKENLTLVFGICAMGMGVNAIGAMKNMPAVILAIVLGTAIGLVLHLKKRFEQGAMLMQKPFTKFINLEKQGVSEADFMFGMITIIILFCCSSTGIYGALDLGMTGDSTILISKSILDFFTAAIFACNLGYIVSTIAIPQFLIFFVLFIVAKFIFPHTTPAMINDFKACGGFIMIATGIRMLKIKDLPVAEMIPAMVLVMPLSSIWVDYIMPLL